jgi:Na+/H+ antiporter NhaA
MCGCKCVLPSNAGRTPPGRRRIRLPAQALKTPAAPADTKSQDRFFALSDQLVNSFDYAETLGRVHIDALMAIFFLLICLELQRELYNGELSDIRNAMLPIPAAAGGIAAPALIHCMFNGSTSTQAGIGIPMATDIAFALGVLSLLGSSVPASLKIFLAGLAVMDDLGAIIVIAVFYTAELYFLYLLAALGLFAVLTVMNRVLRIMALLPYLLGGALMWFLMLKSGVHATIAGMLLAFAIPCSAKQDAAKSPSHRLENALHTPVAYAEAVRTRRPIVQWPRNTSTSITMTIRVLTKVWAFSRRSAAIATA